MSTVRVAIPARWKKLEARWRFSFQPSTPPQCMTTAACLPLRDLQIADERLALERNLDDRKRRLVMLRRFAEQAQRVPIGLLLARRAGDGITGDMAILERKRVELREFLPRCAGFGARVRLPLVGETDLAPRRGPVIAIEAG